MKQTFTITVERTYSLKAQITITADSLEEAQLEAFEHIRDANLIFNKQEYTQQKVNDLSWNEAQNALNARKNG